MMKTGTYAEISAAPAMAGRNGLIRLLPDMLLLISP